MEEGRFLWILSEDLHIDVATIDPANWTRIKETAKYLIKSGECKEVGKAYIAAFLVYISELDALADDYDPKVDKMM